MDGMFDISLGTQLAQETGVFLFSLARANGLACLVALGFGRLVLDARGERFEDVPADITVERFADLADRCLVQCLCDLGSVATLGEPAHVATDVGGIGIL